MAGLFSQGTLDQVRAASDIVDVIGSYLPLKRAGTNFVALCPFHKEKTPSFHVNPQRQTFHCFGCHKGGNVFTFVKEFENIDFPEAVRRLAERARIPLEYEKGAGEAARTERHLKEQLLQMHEQVAQRWQNALNNEACGQIARDYLARRGVPADAVKLFRLGYAPDLWDDTVNWAKNKGYEPGLVEKAGLILRKEGSDHYYDRFRGRLMFPICDEQGRVVGFSGRILAGDEKTAKYVNSPETPIFIKSRVFFGLDKSKRAILDAGFALVCEGQLDLIACYMAGVENVVAPQGTAFTADHARILKRYVDEVVLCFDSDTAGQNAAVRSLDHLLASGLAVRVATVPAPHDPDSFIKASGGEAFKQLIGRAEGFFDYYLNRLCATHDLKTDKGRLRVLHEMSVVVNKSGNAALLDTYARETAGRLGLPPDGVAKEFVKMSRQATPPSETPDDALQGAPSIARPNEHEFHLLKLLMRHDDLLPWAASHLDLDWIQHPLVKDALSRRLAAEANGTWTGVDGLLAEFQSAEASSLLSEAATEERPIPNPAQQLADVVQWMRNASIDRELTALKQRANRPEASESERLELLKQQQSLRSLKRQPLA